MQDSETAIVAFIADMQGAGAALPVGRETQLMETGLLDSIGLVRLIQFVEERFGISIPDADVTPDIFATPAALAAYVEARR